MRFPALALVCLSAPLAAHAGGGYLDLSVSTGGGYDSNVFVDYEDSLSPGVISSPFLAASPGLSLRVESGLLTLETPLDASFRYFVESDAGYSLSWHTRPTLFFAYGRFSASAAYLMDSYSTSEFGADDNLFRAGAATVRYRPADSIGLRAGYEGGIRSFPNRWLEGISEFQENVEHRPAADATVSILRSLDASLRYGFEFVDGNSDEFDETAHELALRAAWEPLDRVLLVPFARAKFKEYTKASRNDRLFAEGIEVRYGVSDWFFVSAYVSRSDNLSSEPGAGYNRNLAMVSVQIEYPVKLWTEALAVDPTAQRFSATEPGRPGAAMSGRSATFAYLAPGAKSVTITGSFNAWARPGVALSGPDAEGLWVVELRLPAGVTEFHFVVDGKPAPPQSAPAFLPDGFGGKNGVVTVE